ncbi:MAG: hypothetical protein U0Q22_09345 [Acidimicrobiales bacterium]
MRRDLGGTLTLGPASDVSGASARRFSVAVRGGTIEALVTYRSGVLFTVSMFAPGAGGPSAAASAAFDAVLASFRLL